MLSGGLHWGQLEPQSPGVLGDKGECILTVFLPKHEEVVSFTFQTPFVILVRREPWGVSMFGARHGASTGWWDLGGPDGYQTGFAIEIPVCVAHSHL